MTSPYLNRPTRSERQFLLEKEFATPKIVDNDYSQISAEINGVSVRSWFYQSDEERRVQMLMAREFTEGWYQAVKRIKQQEAIRLICGYPLHLPPT